MTLTAPSAVPAPPSVSDRRAAWVAVLSVLLGFIPLHLVWALGIPLWADEALFRTWYEDGAGLYLTVLNGLAVLPAVLALAMVQPWGLRLPRRLPVVAGFALSAFLLAYAAFAVVLSLVLTGSDRAIFSPWIVVYGVPQFIVWAVSLALATRSYARRTSQPT